MQITYFNDIPVGRHFIFRGIKFEKIETTFHVPCGFYSNAVFLEGHLKGKHLFLNPVLRNWTILV